MNLKHFLIFIGLSLLLHLVLLLLAFSPFLAPLFVTVDMPDWTDGRELTLTVTRQPSAPADGEKKIIDTEQSIPTNQPVEHTPFEGDRDTRAASPTPGQGNPNVPNNPGKEIPGQDLFTQRYAPSATPAPPAPPSPPAPARQAKPDGQRAEQRPKFGLRDVPVRPGGQLTTGDPSASRPASQAAAARPPAEPRPAASFSTSRIASRMIGGAADDDGTSIAVRETEEGRYKVKLYRAIGSRWYQYVHMDTGLLNIGTVKIKFYVKANGTISGVEITSGRDNEALVAISRRSIVEVSGQLEPFSPSMREKLGDGFWDDVNFSIY
ncbi:MAG: hypothetical protein LBK60_11925 [Verrucomicrobiales bacterium]|nr:hypothetical protein [Verrucomicrobiales bacterium]